MTTGSRQLKDMTICYASVGGFAGVYRTLKQARTLSEQGATVIFAAYEDLMPQVYEESGIRTVSVKRATSKSTSTHPVRLIRVLMNLTWFRVKNWRSARNMVHDDLVRAVVALRPDVVQCVELPGLATCRQAARKAGARLVYDGNELWTGFVRNPDLGMSSKQAKRLLDMKHRTIGKADLVLTTSEELAQWLQERYHIRRPVVLYNAPPSKVESAGEVSRPVRLVFHGGLSADRNLDGLFRAMKMLQGRATLDVYGFDRTVSAQDLQGLVEELGLQDSVRIRGPFRYGDVVDLLHPYDVGVMAAKPVEDNFLFTLPNKLFDCMCAGVAVAMYDSPAMRRIIEQTGCGAIIDPGTPDSIARDVGALVDDPERILRMKQAAVASAALYWWPEQGQKLLAAMTDIMSL